MFKTHPISEDCVDLGTKNLNETLNPMDTCRICSEKYKNLWKKAFKHIKIANRFQKIHRSSEAIENPYTVSEQLLENYLHKHVFHEIEVKFSFPLFVVSPQGKFYLIWLCIMTITLLYIAIVDPYLASFVDVSNHAEILVTEIIIDAVFIVDFLISMNLAYYNDDGNLVTSHQKILVEYAKSWMIVDGISSVPFGLIAILQSSNSSTSGILKLVRLRNIPKLLRLTRFGRMIKNFLFLEDIDYLISKHSKKIRFFKVVLVVFICLHLVSCSFFLVAKLDNFSPDTWVYRNNLLDMTLGEQYETSLYWAITTMTTVGYGDIVPLTYSEKTLAMLWMIVGVYVISYSVGSLTSFYNALGIKDNLIHSKMILAEGFAAKTGVPKKKLYELKRVIRNSDVLIQKCKLEKLFKSVSIDLKLEIAKNIYNGAINTISFFSCKDLSFVANIALRLEFQSLSKNQRIWMAKEACHGIYFIIEGKIAYYSNAVPFMIFGDGHYFGDIEIIYQSERKFDVNCIENSKLLFMNNNTIKIIEEVFPKNWLMIKNDSEIRLRNLIQNLSEMHLIKEFNDSGKIKEINFQHFRAEVKKKFVKNFEIFSVREKEQRRMKMIRELDETEYFVRKSDEKIDLIHKFLTTKKNSFKF